MIKNITTRQIIIFYCIYSFSIKFLSLPSLLAKHAGRDAWIAALVGVTIELLVLWATISYINSKQNRPLKQNIKNNIIIKFLALVALAIFIYQLIIIVNQTYKLLDNNLFENLSPYLFYIPMILLGVFFCIEPSKAIFRSGEIFFVFIIFGIVLSVFPVLNKVNPSEVLPIMQNGLWPVLKSTLINIVFFESVLFLLIFRGEIDISKKFKTKFMLTAILVNLFFVIFVFMFISIHGELAQFKSVAITISSVRLDWVVTTMWLLLLLLRFGITFFCAWRCIKSCLKF